MAATFSYNGALSSELDMCRFLIGDTVASTQIFSNEEIEALLVKHPSPEVCAGYCMRIIANDPVRTEALWDATHGSFTRVQLSQKFGKFADRWLK